LSVRQISASAKIIWLLGTSTERLDSGGPEMEKANQANKFMCFFYKVWVLFAFLIELGVIIKTLYIW
jgi:hypothetical protein